MSSFSGFSEADIRKLQNGERLPNPPNAGQKVALTQNRFPNAKGNKQVNNKQEARKRMVLENKINNTGATAPADLPNEAKLVAATPTKIENANDNEVTTTSTVTVTSITENKEITNIVVDKAERKEVEVGTGKKCIDLDGFPTKQKLMEEQNRIRKEQVQKALADRTKRTQQEQQKLVEIQNEFKKLDAHLSNDVKILRKQIENASYDYMEAQKRYNKIEKEFLDTKLYLHQKLEKKQMLTEHLCTIIEKNEERKADKLNELLQKLEVLEHDSTSVQLQVDQVTSNELN